MNVRIIAGKYGGRTIDAPDNARTHPMGERVRGALFNSLASRIEDAVVLDAFAGSGSIGLEALSRGASHVTFIEKDRLAATILRKNIETLDVISRTKAIQSSVSSWCDTTESQLLFDIIFADPPYHNVQLSTVERLFSYVKPGGFVILSHPGKGERHFGTNDFVVVDDRRYGNAHLTYFRRNDI